MGGVICTPFPLAPVTLVIIRLQEGDGSVRNSKTLQKQDSCNAMWAQSLLAQMCPKTHPPSTPALPHAVYSYIIIFQPHICQPSSRQAQKGKSGPVIKNGQ